MKTKLRFLWVLLALLLGEVGDVWADTTYESYKNSDRVLVNTSGYFSYDGDLSDIQDLALTTDTETDGNINIPTALKLQGNTSISFTVSSSTATVYIGVYIKVADQNKFQFDDNTQTLSLSTLGANEIVQINVSTGTHSITKTSGNEVGIYYILNSAAL